MSLVARWVYLSDSPKTGPLVARAICNPRTMTLYSRRYDGAISKMK